MEDFYDLLEVSEDASTDEIHRAWRQKVRTYHPDVNDDSRANAQFKTLKKAHEVLSDETERAAYDRLGHAKYVRERLDGLPTKTGGGPATGGDRATETSGSTEDTGTQNESETHRSSSAAAGQSAGGSSRFGRRRKRTESDGANRTNRTATAGSTRSQGSGGRSTTRTGRSAAGRNRSSTAGNSHSSGTGGGSSPSANEGGTASSHAATTASTARASGGFGSPLLYGWLGVALSAILYLAGVSQYVRANAAAVSSLSAAVTADPVGALTSARIVAPGTFVLNTAAVDAPLSLLFPAGVGAFAFVFTAVVLAFGRGSAYLYLLGSLAPLAGLTVGPVIIAPDGVVLTVLVVLPLGATVLFLGDVGRVVFGS
ncbi:molecular chaperone DnaJ [Halobellus sp. Atlit-31R]|nr:molecular chaperone DnaJ [Halobellus sp. Atlit-31R]